VGDIVHKKDILFVVDERRMGGVSILLEDMLNMMDMAKYNVDILVLHDNGEMLSNLPNKVNVIYGTKYFCAIDYPIKEIIKSRNFKLLISKLRVMFDMKTGNIKRQIIKERKKILSKKYDVEIAFKDGFTAVFTAFGDAKKKVHWLHYEYKTLNPNANYDKLFRKILPTFDEIIAVSDGVMDAFNNVYHLEDKTRVICNLVDTKKIINKSKEKSDVVLSSNDLNYVSVGRLHEQKGYDNLITAINILNVDGFLPKNFKLRIFGDGPQRQGLSSLIEQYNLEKHVFLMGKVMNPYKYLSGSDMFVLSSKYEPFGLVIVEAMTLGLPVLATVNHATNKLISNKENGYIVDNSVEGLYDGLKYMFENADELKKYKDNLKKYKYENSAIIKEIERVLSND